MCLLSLALISLLVTTARSASIQSSVLPAPAGLYTDATAPKTPSDLILPTDSSVPIDVTESCAVVIISTFTTTDDVTTLFRTTTVTVATTIMVEELAPQSSTEAALATQTSPGLLLPREHIPCPNCIPSSTEAGQPGARVAQSPVLKARQPFPRNATATEPACPTTITSVTTLTLPGNTVTSSITVVIPTTVIVRNPPKTLSPAESFSFETPAMTSLPETASFSTASSLVAINLPELQPPSPDQPKGVLQPQNPTANAAEAESSGTSISPQNASPAGSVSPVVQTPTNSMSVSTPSPQESPPAEEGFASPPDDPPSPVNATPPPAPVGSSISQSVSGNPAPQLTPSPPSPGRADSETQVQRVQTPNVIQNQPPPGSTPPSVFSTQVTVQQSPIPVVPAGAPQPPIITLGTDTFAPVASPSFYIIDGQTLAPGGPAITVSNSVLSLATTSGTQLVVAPADTASNGQPPIPATTIQLFSNLNPTPASNPVIATIDGSPITLNPSASSLIFTQPDGSPITLIPGAPALTLPGGTIVSLSPANPTDAPSPSSPPVGPVLVINNPGDPSAQSITFPTPIITFISTSPITLNPSASSIVFTPSTGPPLTLLPGSPAITLTDGTILSFSPSPTNPVNPANPPSPLSPPVGPVLVISSPDALSAQSITLASPLPPSPHPTNLPIRISSPPFLVVGGSTLSPGGPAVTISGVPVSFGAVGGAGPSNSVLVVGSSTITIAPTATGIGGYLYTGLSGGASSGVSSVTSITSPNLGSGSGMVTSTLPATAGGSGIGPGFGSGLSPSATSTMPLPATNMAVRHLSLWAWEKSRIASALLGLLWSLVVWRAY